MQAPSFWFNSNYSLLSDILIPFSWVFRLVSSNYSGLIKPWKAPIPVICIGNLVAGGQGKTPTAISVGEILNSYGKSIHFLTRGYGGNTKGPVLVQKHIHTYKEVGDEALLLAEIAPTWVSANRRAGIEAAFEKNAEIIVMDDGFQNFSITKDLSIITIDGEVGFGNGRLIPAGPLREGISIGLSRAQIAVIIGKDRLCIKDDLENRFGNISKKAIYTLSAQLKSNENLFKLSGKNVHAFAGIGRPEKFFSTLAEMNCNITAMRKFPDHHPYTEMEIKNMLIEAEEQKSTLITTTKDFARVPDSYKKDIAVLPVKLDWNDKSALESFLMPYF